jgi:hypothetical protein
MSRPAHLVGSRTISGERETKNAKEGLLKMKRYGKYIGAVIAVAIVIAFAALSFGGVLGVPGSASDTAVMWRNSAPAGDTAVLWRNSAPAGDTAVLWRSSVIGAPVEEVAVLWRNSCDA